jgi:NAD(P)-dependent dehydrogenase (short-subunit alcohol dehydrogenase family)
MPTAVLVAAKISAAGGAASAVTADVASEEGISAIFDEAARQAGRVDVVCTFADNYIPEAFDTMTVSELALLLNLHRRGNVPRDSGRLLVHAARYGRIMTVASRGAFPHSDDSRDVPPEKRVTLSAGYSAAKAAIMGLTAVATDLVGRPEEIAVSCLLPSAQTQLLPASVPRAVGGIPGAANLDPAALAPLVVYLSSAEGGALNGRFIYGGGGDVALLPTPRGQPRARRCSARRMSGALAISRLCLARRQVLAARDSGPR